MPHRFQPKPATALITVRFPVKSAREARDTLMNAWCATGLYRQTLTAGPERRGLDRARSQILKLSRWYAMLIDGVEDE